MILVKLGELETDIEKKERVDSESAVQDSELKTSAGMDTSVEFNISEIPTTEQDEDGKEWLVYDSIDNNNRYWVDFAEDSMEVNSIYLAQDGVYKKLNATEHVDLFEFITSINS